ncbi:MAG: amino acid ABC transporter permease [Hyphomicrobiaceae bacterium]|jgi:His/Glu/Gln/Arg/opine family amino acid ABC transporter permease subunit
MGQYRAWIEAYGVAFLEAAGWTLAVAVASFICALIWGALLFFARLRGGIWTDRIVDGYVQLLRNIPVLLPIYLIYFGFPLAGLLWPAAICGGIALVLQNGAYISEIFRGAYKAIDRVQHDAARSLGLLPWMAFRKVTLPQILVHSIPALGNQAVLLLKDTSLLSAITVVELTMQAKVLTERTGAAYAPFVVAAIFYLAMVSIIELLARTAHRSVRWK